MKEEQEPFAKHKNSDAFKTPDNYFEEFPTQIQSIIFNDKKEMSWKEKFSIFFVTRFFVTTSIAFLLAIGIFTIHQLTIDSRIDGDEVYNYLVHLDEDEIDLELMSEYAMIYPKISYEPSEEQIIEYLSEEEIEEFITNQ